LNCKIYINYVEKPVIVKDNNGENAFVIQYIINVVVYTFM
jgi:hypothetical protein